MSFSAKKEYEIALVTRQYAMTVAELQQRIASIRLRVIEKDMRASGTWLLYISDERSLLAAIHALMQLYIHTICIMRATENVGVKDIAAEENYTGIITEEPYASLFPQPGVIVIKEDDLPPVDGWQINEKAMTLIFRDAKTNTITVSGSELTTFFDQLDAVVDGLKTDRIFLSRCLPFSRLVTEMIWASFRGITIVVDTLNEQTPFARYTFPGCTPEMQFSLFFFGSYVADENKNKYQLLTDAARFADTHGFSAVWTPERHFNAFGGLYPNPSVLSAALAMITSRVQIRSGSLVSPLHHPVRIAEDWSLVDNLSNGRVGISFASGWQCDDFIFFPENYAQRHDHMLQQIKMIETLWAGETVACKNGLGKEIAISLFPKPIQQKLPVWITVSGKIETFIDAGKIGAHILTHLLWQNSEELIEKIAAYRRSLHENGFDPASRTVSVMVHTHLGENNEAVKEKVRDPLTDYIRSSTQLIQNMAKSNAEAAAADVAGRYGDVSNELPAERMDELAAVAFQRFFEQASLLGTLKKGKNLIRRLKGYGVDELACLIDFGLDKDNVMQGLVYLDRLRAACSADNECRYPVNITHCSSETLQRFSEDADLADFFSAQDLVLAEAGHSEKIPAALIHKTKIIHNHPDTGSGWPVRIVAHRDPADNKAVSFNAVLANEF